MGPPTNYGTSLVCSLVFVLCSACTTAGPTWKSIEPTGAEYERVLGAWENSATGHLVTFSPAGFEVYHALGEFCVRDTGVVPEYSLYRLENGGDRLALQYFDYRQRPELLQAPQVFQRIPALPEYCNAGESEGGVAPAEVYGLITQTFDRFYPFFEQRHVDWASVKREYAARAEKLSTDQQLFDLLAEMLAPLGDGHVNLTWSDRFFSAGRPRLRARLAEVWANSDSDLSEGDFVRAWHQAVLESVYTVLDSESLRSGAAGALEWGTIADSVGYVRINRFTGFTSDPGPRPAQYDSVDAALIEMRADLAYTSTLIVDVALNGGGSDAAALLIAAYFADQRRPVLTYAAAGAPFQQIFVTPRAPGERRPILLLTSEVTASAAESFVLMMRAFPHVTHVGERTRGGLSSLLPKPMPNGFALTLSYQMVIDSEGNQFEGLGIPPSRKLELFPDDNVVGGFAVILERLARASP